MPSPLIDVTSALLCPHGGKITIVPAGVQATIDGAPVASLLASGVVSLCTNIGPTLKPCSKVTWTLGASSVLLNGVPALVATSLAVFDSVPPVVGVPATVVQTQAHAVAT